MSEVSDLKYVNNRKFVHQIFSLSTFIVFILVGDVIAQPFHSDSWQARYALSWIVLKFILSLTVMRKSGMPWVSVFSIFYVFLCFFHFPSLIFWTFSRNPPDQFFYFEDSWLFRNQTLINLGLSAYLCSGLIVAKFTSKVKSVFVFSEFKFLLPIMYPLLSASLVAFIVIQWPLLEIARDSGYIAIYKTLANSFVSEAFRGLLINVIPLLSMVILLIEKHGSKLRFFLITHCIIYSVFSLAIGSRAPVVFLAAQFGLAHAEKLKGFRPLVLLLSIGFLSICSLAMIGRMRENRFDFSLPDWGSIANEGFWRAIGELVTTERISVIAPDILTQDAASHGRYFYSGLYNILPQRFADFVGFERQPFLSDAFARLLDPGWAAAGGGFGFSFFAEAIFYSGPLGVITLCTFVGIILSFLSIKGGRGNENFLTLFSILILPNLLRWTRGELLDVSRGVVWFGILPVMLLWLIAALRRYLRSLEERSNVPN